MLRLTLLLLIVGCGDGWKRVDEIDNGIVKDNSMENPPVLVWKRRISGSSRQNDTPRWGCDIESVFFRLNDAKTMREIVASPLLIRNDQNNETYVVVLSVVGRLLMLNARHGTEVWSVDIKVRRATCSIYDSSCRSSKFVARSMTATPEFDSDRGHIIVSDISGVVVAVSVLDGSIVWTWHVDELEEIRGVVAPALLGNIIINRNVILVPLTNSSLFELDASTGLNKRSWQISDRILASPSSYHGADGVTYYYVASWDGSLIAIDSKSEEQIWHVKIGDGIESSPLVVSSKIVFGELRDVKYRETEKEPFEMWNFVSVIYIKSTSGTLFCVAHIVKENDKSHHMGIKVYSSDGLSFEMPTFDTGFNIFLTSLIRSSPVFDRKNHAVLVLSSNGMIRSVDAKINSTRWSRRLALDKVSTFTASPNIYFDNLLIVGSWSGNLYGISSRDGSLLWIKQMCGGISSPVVSTRLDSNVLRSFAVTHYGEILAFDLVRSSEHNTKNRPRRRQRKQQQERQQQFPTPTALTNQIQSWIQSKMFVSNEECPVTDPSTRYVVFENPIHDWGLASFVRILMRLVLDIVLKQHQHDQKTFLILDNVRSVYVSRINCEERRPSILCLLRPLGPCKLTHAQEAKNHFGDHVVEFIKLNVKNSSSVDDFDSRRICRAFDSSLFLNRASVPENSGGVAFVLGQIAAFVMRPNRALESLMTHIQVEIDFESWHSRSIGVHMRLGDKSSEYQGIKAHGVHTYFERIRTLSFIHGYRDVFISSDNFNASLELRRLLEADHFRVYEIPKKYFEIHMRDLELSHADFLGNLKLRVGDTSPYDEGLTLLAQAWMLSKCDALLGTFTSNYFQLIYELSHVRSRGGRVLVEDIDRMSYFPCSSWNQLPWGCEDV